MVDVIRCKGGHIAALPENVLLDVFQLLSFHTRRVVCPLVCKSWSQLCKATPALYSDVLLDFPTECLPLPAIYPEHEDQPWVDIAAVGRWVARRLPGVQQLCFECRHSRTYNNPSFDPHVAMEITSQDVAALLGVMSPKLAGLRVEACDDMVDGALLGTLWCCSMLRTLGLHDLGYPLDVRRFNAGLRHLSQLEVLEVHSHASEHGWGLEGFPAMLCTLPVLRTLSLTNQRDVETLPAAISQLTGLQELMLRNCGIHGLPTSLSVLTSLTSLAIEGVSSQAAVSLELRDWLGALTNLAELSLKRSLLGCCPAELAALGALRRLDVSHSRLAGLPVELSRLTELEELNLASNDFASLPEAVSALGGLRKLDLYGNCLGDGFLVGHMPPGLTWLDLSRNHLPTVPPAVSFCTALVHLALGGNKLHDLPAELGALSMLEKLDVQKNCLNQVPAVLGTLRGLRHVILDGNPLAIDEPGAQTLLALPRLAKLSARVRSPRPDACASEVLPPGSCVAEGVSPLRPQQQPQPQPQQQQPQQQQQEQGAAQAQRHQRQQRWSPAEAAARDRRAAQVWAWRRLAKRLAAEHGRTVLNVEGLQAS